MIDQTRIAQCNAANASAMFLQESLREILTPYLGRKAWKISGYGGPVAALERDLQALQTQGHFFLQKSVSWLRPPGSWVQRLSRVGPAGSYWPGGNRRWRISQEVPADDVRIRITG